MDALFALFVTPLVLFGSFAAQYSPGPGQGQEWEGHGPGGPGGPWGPGSWTDAIAPGVTPLDGIGVVLLLTTVIALALRRTRPLATLLVTGGATAIYLALGYAYGPILFTVAVATYTAHSTLPVRRAGGATIGVFVLLVVAGVTRSDAGGVLAQLSGAAGLGISLVACGAVGMLVRTRRWSVRERYEDEQRRRAYEERLTVAREVHDVVGHGLAVINMQAGVALHVLDRRPEQARVALEAIKAASKDSLEELRGTLAVFRSQDGEGGSEEAPRRPPPGLHRLDALGEAMAASGLQVSITVVGDRPEVPAAVDLAAYRIVQESLTNVLKHAGPATAGVRVTYEPGAVAVEVTDDGQARLGDTISGGGHGLTGMRERAAAVGGTLEAGPRPAGGFAVRARLPFGEAQSFKETP
ncbi:MAG: sensor histidine kinase [Streptosporangiales bacterium]|nr:sensor histidine kinase [Streptosporangiales bacterium]